MDDSDLITACQQIYAETNDTYNRYRQQLGANDFGFKILYGPPRLNAPVLFIGDQPGGNVADEKPNERYGWPSRCEYATESWTLARNMRNMFGSTLLMDCVGINANFFRAPNSKSWSAVPKSIRDILEKFCSVKLATIISLMAPQQIITIGSSTLKKFGPSEPILYGTKNRVLMRSGKIGQWAATSTLHLSGAQLARGDRLAIANAILALAERGSISMAGNESTLTPREPIPLDELNQFGVRNMDKQEGAPMKNAPIASAQEGVGAMRAVQTGGVGPEDTMRIILQLQPLGLDENVYKVHLHHRNHSMADMRAYASKYPDRQYKTGSPNLLLHQKLEWILRVCREKKVPPGSADEIRRLDKETTKKGWSPDAAS
jgi:hypothetical protein